MRSLGEFGRDKKASEAAFMPSTSQTFSFKVKSPSTWKSES